MALARELARSIDVPIQWVMTSGYGASKRFFPESSETVKLLDPPDSIIHLAALADIESRLAAKGVGAINVSCELLHLPYANPDGYRVAFRADQSFIDAPAGSRVIFNVNVENKANQSWSPEGPNYLRLGVQLKTPSGQTVSEVGARLSSKAAIPGGRESISIPIDLPPQLGGVRCSPNAREYPAQYGVDIAVSNDVDAHCIGRRRGFSHCEASRIGQSWDCLTWLHYPL